MAAAREDVGLEATLLLAAFGTEPTEDAQVAPRMSGALILLGYLKRISAAITPKV